MKIINVNESNLAQYPQVICFINPKHEHHGHKLDWLKKRFEEGLIIKLLQPDEKTTAGFIEYVPGEYAWRAVSAADYLFIHCLWVYPNKNKGKGFGTALVEEAVADAKRLKKAGVAVVTSSKSFMAEQDLFIKNGFQVVSELEDFQLLTKRLNRKHPLPAFHDCKAELKKYKGWHIVYSKQCPWVARFMEEAKPIIKRANLSFAVHEMKQAKEAQHAPSVYATFNLIKDGRILADRYISTTRFQNILKKEKD